MNHQWCIRNLACRTSNEEYCTTDILMASFFRLVRESYSTVDHKCHSFILSFALPVFKIQDVCTCLCHVRMIGAMGGSRKFIWFGPHELRPPPPLKSALGAHGWGGRGHYTRLEHSFYADRVTNNGNYSISALIMYILISDVII